MIADRIDFISEYCDRWCERCAFTNRCSAYACQVAIEMCDGDIAAGIELAVGQPQPVGSEKEKTVGQQLMEQFEQDFPSEKEVDAWDREEKARRRRIRKKPLIQIADTYIDIALAWTKDYADRTRSNEDKAVSVELDIIEWDIFLIGAKLRRALDGRDRRDQWDDHPVQNDWNGSAKVALISLARSEDAWRRMAKLPDTCGAVAVVVDAIARLRHVAMQEFPDAMRFKRPGFDDVAADDDARIC